MRCSNCGTDNQDDAAFCRACGHLLTTPAAAIAAANHVTGPAAAAVSPFADGPRCRHCQAPLAPGARFCDRCGQLTAAPAVAIETLARNYPPPPPTPRRGAALLFGAALLVAAVALGVYWDQEHAAPALLAGEPPVMPAAVEAAGTPVAAAPDTAAVGMPPASVEPEPAAPPARPAPARRSGKTGPKVAAPAVAASPVAPAAEPPPARPALPVWYAGLKDELRRCDADSRNFFSRTYCKEKAKFHFCGPDHWGQVPECVKTATKADY